MATTTKHDDHQLQSQKISIEELAERFHKAVPVIVRETLKAGVSVCYVDESGQLVKENPDGTIEILERAE